MTAAYAYTPHIWPPLLAAIFLAALSLGSWRRRAVPAALPLAAGTAFGVVWLLGVTLEVAAVAPAAAIAWHKFQAAWQLPAATAITCFALEYTYPGRWLTRRNLALLALPPLLVALLIVTNDAQFMWRRLEVGPDGLVVRQLATPGFVLMVYGVGLILVNMAAFIWLSIRSPQHRWPAALMLSGDLAGRVFYGLYQLNVTPVRSLTLLDSFVVALLLEWTAYAIALFGFRIFNPLPAARATAIRQMREGMVVLDGQWRVASVNPAAAAILSTSEARARGKTLAEILPALAGLSAQLTALPATEGSADQAEISLGSEPNIRRYALDLSVLKDFRGLTTGHLLLLRDVTEWRRTQEQIREQQAALAALHEREQIARELHDGLGQVLAYVSMQAQAIARRVQAGDLDAVEVQLRRLADVTQEAHADIRESIVNLRSGRGGQVSLLETLRQQLALYSEHYGIQGKFSVGPGIEEAMFAPATGVQLLRVIQEALTNARKHGGARSVTVDLARADGEAVIVVQDDGAGFDPEQAAASARNDHYGLDFMAERMAEIGGSLKIQSTPGAGTRIVLRAPLQEGRVRPERQP